MATKKSVSKKTVKKEKTLLEKAGETASHIKDEIVATSAHLVDIAKEKLEAAKSTFNEYRSKNAKPKKSPVKKTAKKTAVKAAPKKRKKELRPSPKKASPKKSAGVAVKKKAAKK